MHVLHFGATEITGNKRYIGVSLIGTGIELTKNVMMSINGTAFAQYYAGEEIYKVDTYTYIFKEDTVIKNIFIEKPLYSQTYQLENKTDIAVVANVQTADIVLLQNTEQSVSPITAGEITALFRLKNNTAGSATISIQFYKTGVAYGSPIPETINNGETRDYVKTIPVSTAFAITDDVSFRITVNASATILGTELPSILRIRRDNL